MFPKLLLLIGVLAILASWPVRVALFAKAASDRTFRDLTENTFATTFSDLLFLQLYRKKSGIDPRFSSLVSAYFWLNVSAFVFIVAGGLGLWIAA